jgi:hypothetical protein
MRGIFRYLSSFCLGATLAITTASAGCAGRVRIYDSYHTDYHRWDHHEDVAYRRYLGERHEEYRDFSKLDGDRQKDYWDWRHSHPDPDHR